MRGTAGALSDHFCDLCDYRVTACVLGLQVAFLTSFAAFPWVVKPLYGFLSDTVPIFGYRRRSYLIICGILGTLPFPFLPLLCVPGF